MGVDAVMIDIARASRRTSMQNFEQVRSHVSGNHPLKTNDPYLLSFDIELEDGSRHQGIYLTELENEDGSRYLRISSPVGLLSDSDAERCLRFNWMQRSGYLAVGDVDDEAWLHLCENRPYALLNGAELDRLIADIGPFADQLEQFLASPGDNL